MRPSDITGLTTPLTPAATTLENRPLIFALTGTLSLAVAMGIGRFAFTPLMPMMLHDQVLDLPSASWLASANYFGYLLGALLCSPRAGAWVTYHDYTHLLPAASFMPDPV